MAGNSRKFNKTASQEKKRAAAKGRALRGERKIANAKRILGGLAGLARRGYDNIPAPDLPRNRDIPKDANSQSKSIQRMRVAEKREAQIKQTAREAITPKGRGQSMLTTSNPDGMTRLERRAKRKADIKARRQALSQEYSGENRIIASNSKTPINPTGPALDWRQHDAARRRMDSLKEETPTTREDKAEALRRRQATRRGRTVD